MIRHGQTRHDISVLRVSSVYTPPVIFIANANKLFDARHKEGQRTTISRFVALTRRAGCTILLRTFIFETITIADGRRREEGPRRFVIIKRFMGNYNVPVSLWGGGGRLSSQCPDTKPFSTRDIKRTFAVLFIRSAHKRRFTITTRPCPPVSSFLSVCFSLVISFSWTCSMALLLGQNTDRLAACPDRRVVSTTSAKEPRRLACSPRVRLFLRDLIKTEFNRPLDKLPPQY